MLTEAALAVAAYVVLLLYRWLAVAAYVVLFMVQCIQCTDAVHWCVEISLKIISIYSYGKIGIL